MAEVDGVFLIMLLLFWFLARLTLSPMQPPRDPSRVVFASKEDPMPKLNLPSGKKPATNVAGHEIQQPRTRDTEWDREVTLRNDMTHVDEENEVTKEDEDEAKPSKSPTPDKTSDVKEKKE